MTKKAFCSVLLMILIVFFAGAQESPAGKLNSLGVNLLHPLTVELGASLLLEDSHNIPINLTYSRALDRHWGASAQLIYIWEVNNRYRVHQIGLAAGPRLAADYLKGAFVDLKVGLGYAFGVDYDEEDYTRLDFVLKPEAGYNLLLTDFLSLSFGIGLQSLLRITESPSREGRWEWGRIGQMSHYYLPVGNVSVNLLF